MLDEEGVTEIIGFLLGLGILGVLVIAVILGHQEQIDNGRDNALDVRLQRSADDAVRQMDTLLRFLEDNGGVTAAYAASLGTPGNLHAQSVTATASGPTLTLNAGNSQATATALWAATDYEICDFGAQQAGPLRLMAGRLDTADVAPADGFADDDVDMDGNLDCDDAALLYPDAWFVRYTA